MKTIILLLIITSIPLLAQIQVTRNVIPIIDQDTTKRGSVLDDFVFSPEFANGSGSYKGDMDWTLKLIGYAEVYRFKNDMALAFLLGHELNANPYNDISFNPRKAIWEENISVFSNNGDNAYSFGIFHRCKHDIDLTEREKELNQFISRVIILSGVNASYSFENKYNKLKMLTRIYGEYYLVNEDYKKPDIYTYASFQDMIASIRISSVLTYELSKIFDFRLISSISNSLSEKKNYTNNSKNNIDARVETSITLKGKQNNLDLFFAYETMFEETTQVIPSPSTFWNIGLRFRPKYFK